MMPVRREIRIRGTVQGVGFRPFVFNCAKEFGLSGFIANTPHGVEIQVQGRETEIDGFVKKIRVCPPPASRIEEIAVKEIETVEESGFFIRPSIDGSADTFVSPDIGTCKACFEEISNPHSRRYAYAFTNCTSCGPRFSMIEAVPYDRKNTTMSGFEMCGKCREEYENVADRRFHAEPVACADCGPELEFVAGSEVYSDAFKAFKDFVSRGKTVAVKGLGGYHLACDAFNENAVSRLRARKHRFDKPFAVMVKTVEQAEKLCVIDDTEKKLLQSPARPIVLLKKRENCAVAPGVAPQNNRLGVMLAYTPLHYLLMDGFDALVMTSANLSDEPTVFADEDALRLESVADAFLRHNRRICRRVDDSVCAVVNGKVRIIRRARGYAPEPLYIGAGKGDLLACGAQQKNTFCLLRNGYAFVSGHMGDLDEESAEKSYKKEIESFKNLFSAKPELAVCDMHPDYVSARFAFASGFPVKQIQHHKAHFISVLAEHSVLDEDVLGFIFDGTGLGEDMKIWGGEMFLGSARSCKRVGHLREFHLAGAQAAINEPWRCAVAVAEQAEKGSAVRLFDKAEIILRSIEAGINSPETSSMGRLFDAVCAIAGVCTEVTYEGQAAILLEQIADESAEGEYRFDICEENSQLIFDWRNLVRRAVEDRLSGVGAGVISMRFHRAVINLITQCADIVYRKYNIKKIALSGGCFQNFILLENAENILTRNGFEVYSNERIPVNDGGISFGQAAAAVYSE